MNRGATIIRQLKSIPGAVLNASTDKTKVLIDADKVSQHIRFPTRRRWIVFDLSLAYFGQWDAYDNQENALMAMTST